MFILHRYNKIAFGLLGALALSISPATALNIGVTPPRFEVKINNNKSKTETIRVLNLDSKPVTLRVSVKSWIMGEDNKPKEVASTEQSLDRWIIFTPTQFTIPPNSAQTVRFAIRPKVEPQPGEHRAVLYFQEVTPQQQTSSSKGVAVVARLGVVIYGQVGEIKRAGVVNSITVESKPNNVNAVFDVVNQGNAHLRLNGQYAIWPADKYPGADKTKPIADLGKPETKVPESILSAGKLPSTPVLPDNRRQVRLPIEKTLPPGNYILDIKGELGGVPINNAVPFTVTDATASTDKKTPNERLRNTLRRR